MAIIVKLIGGLGNQMFQYAAGRSLSKRLNLPLKLDRSKLLKSELRSYKLHHLSIKENIATSDELEQFTIPESGLKALLFKAENYLLPWHLKRIIAERNPGFEKDFFRIKKDCLLQGYWQSEKYFKNIEEIIRNEFRVSEDPGKKNQNLLNKIIGSSSISIHIRRGDYVTNPVTNQYHGFLGLDYYDKAIHHIEKKIESPVFFIFSDDIKWARENIKVQQPAVFVDHNGEDNDYEDLRLMKNCKHHIIANSSFSWWGGWLGDEPNKIVIAPKKWFASESLSKEAESEIIPEQWIRL